MRALEKITPPEFEEHVKEILSSAGGELSEFSVARLEHVEGAGGEYEIDVVARLKIFGAAERLCCANQAGPAENLRVW